MNKIIFTAIAITSMVTIVGCSNPQEIAAKEQKLTNPDVTLIGTFDGCEVKYYERSEYNLVKNFYIAQCEGKSIAVTRFFQQGKSIGSDTNITTEKMTTLEKVEKLNILKKQSADLEKVINEEKTADINKALGKLTLEDKKVLGLK
jgi:hypothetical protein